MNSDNFTSHVELSAAPRYVAAPDPAAKPPASAEDFRRAFEVRDLKTIKRLVRGSDWRGDHPVRKELWTCLLKLKFGGSLAFGNLFDEYWSTAQEGNINLPDFTDPHNMHKYLLNGEGEEATERIIKMIALLKPDITFCPRAFSFTAILLHYYSPQTTFELVCGVLEKRTTQGYLVQTRVSWDASAVVLRDLAIKFSKSGYRCIVHAVEGGDVLPVFKEWIWWIFKDIPFSHMVRVMDVYMSEGQKVLYRVALIILSMFAKHHGGRPSVGVSVTSSLSEFCASIPATPRKLLKDAFGIRGLSRRLIDKLRVNAEQSVRARPRDLDEITNGVDTGFYDAQLLPEVTSGLLSRKDWLQEVWTWLPTRMQTNGCELVFTSEEDGTSLHTLYNRCEEWIPTILLIKTARAEVIGAYCSAPWKERRKFEMGQIITTYFATGETFVFTLSPEKRIYRWVGVSGEHTDPTENMYMAGDTTMLTVGGGNGCAIQLDENLFHGRSSRCDTFDNDPLVPSEDMECAVVEVYGLR